MHLTEHDKAQFKRSGPPIAPRIEDQDRLWRIQLVKTASTLAGEQKKLARAIGIHDAHVSRWIHGVRPVPERWLKPLAEFLEANA